MDILYTISLGILGTVFLIMAGLYIRRFSSLIKNKGIPTIGIFKKHKILIQQHLHIDKESRLIDLGCGVGGALRFFSDTYGCKQLDGVDVNTLALHAGNRRNKKKGYTTISLKKQNIFTTHIHSYNYVYCFLMPSLMGAIETYLQENLGDQSIVICLAFKLPTWKPTRIISDDSGAPKIFLYKKQPA